MQKSRVLSIVHRGYDTRWQKRLVAFRNLYDNMTYGGTELLNFYRNNNSEEILRSSSWSVFLRFLFTIDYVGTYVRER